MTAFREKADEGPALINGGIYVVRPALLDRMPRDERLVWFLKFAEGETLESMAALLGISVSTVQRRLRAAEALAESLRRVVIG